MKQQAGFTLVEIAIVLVIIGLLLGGVLKGQEIITNAKIKNLENDFNGVTAAIYSYQDRYRALPGDDKRAHRRFAEVQSGHSGNGDGDIDGTFNANVNTNGADDGSTTGPESYLFWVHLRSAGLIKGEPFDAAGTIYLPHNAFNGFTGVSSEPLQNTGNGLSPLYVGFSKIPVEVAIIIESRSDDEISNGGSVQTDATGTTMGDYTTITAKEINMYFAL